MDNPPLQDAATKLSLKYLGLLETRLNISWDADALPVCIIEDVDAASLAELRIELVDLLNGEVGSKAREATKVYGTDHIQTVGFGIASDFDQFAKLGFLYGERLVLWDVICSRILNDKDITFERTAIVCQIACNLLLLKGAIERGAAVILPHPITWSIYAQAAARDIQRRRRVSGSHFGLSMALSAVAEGISLHPYALLHSTKQSITKGDFINEAEEFYSKENYAFQQGLETLLSGQEMTYLEDINPSEFQRIVSQYPSLHSDVRKHFALPPGLSAQQLFQESERIQEGLQKLIGDRNRAIRGYAAEGGAATATLVLSSIAALTSASIVPLVSLVGLSVQFLVALRKWFAVPQNQIIIQTFQQLHSYATSRPLIRPLTVSFSPLLDEFSPDAETKEARDRFRSERATEDRHQFLLSLRPDLAHKLLKSLTADDLEDTVNRRRFQEDYIGDYIKDLWDIDHEAFWTHIAKTLESAEGMLIYDSTAHASIMSSQSMPLDVWERLLGCMILAHRKDLADPKTSYEAEVFTDVLRFQTTEAKDSVEKQTALRLWLRGLDEPDRMLVRNFLELVFDGGAPRWLNDSAEKAARQNTAA